MNLEIKKEYDRVFKSLQNSSQLDISHQHNSIELSDLIDSEIESCEKSIQDRLKTEFFSCGPIEPLLNDKSITEIIINGPNSIWLEKEAQLVKYEDEFLSPVTFRNFVLRLCQESKTQVHLDQPCADGQWRDFRVHIIQPPLVQKDFHLSLRRHPESPWTLNQLEKHSWCSSDESALLKKIVQRKENILIIGPTGTGKTSVLNALLQTLPKGERVITIEDTDEIKKPNEVSTKLLTRVCLNGQLQSFDQSDLLKQALRMRPDRIALGEVRGHEAKDLLMAFATGHGGGLCTLHAESSQQALLRLEMLIQMGAPQWSLPAIRNLIFLSLKYVIEVKKEGTKRKMKAIQRIASLEHTGFCLEPVSTLNPYIKI